MSTVDEAMAAIALACLSPPLVLDRRAASPQGCPIRHWCPLTMLTVLVLASPTPARAAYIVTPLVSDQDLGLGVLQDPDLKNAWGLTFRGASPFWVANNRTGVSALYNTSTGAAVEQGLVATMPDNAPVTGAVGNVSSSFNGDLFLFAAENGGIFGWGRGIQATAHDMLLLVLLN